MKQFVKRFYEGRALCDEAMDTKINRFLDKNPTFIIKSISLVDGRGGLEALILLENEEEA